MSPVSKIPSPIRNSVADSVFSFIVFSFLFVDSCGYFRSLRLCLLQWPCRENAASPLASLTNRINHLAKGAANSGAARSVKQLHTCRLQGNCSRIFNQLQEV